MVIGTSLLCYISFVVVLALVVPPIIRTIVAPQQFEPDMSKHAAVARPWQTMVTSVVLSFSYFIGYLYTDVRYIWLVFALLSIASMMMWQLAATQVAQLGMTAPVEQEDLSGNRLHLVLRKHWFDIAIVVLWVYSWRHLFSGLLGWRP